MAQPRAGLDLLASAVRRRIVDTLANLPVPEDGGPDRSRSGMTAQDLAEHLGLHVTTVRFHLDQLVTAGLLTTAFQRGDGAGRPRKLYAVEPGSLDTVPAEGSYQMLSQLLVQSVRTDVGTDGAVRTLTPEEAGARWGRERVAREGLPGEPAPARTPGQWLGKVGQLADLLREWGYVPEVATSAGGRTAEVSLYDCPFLPLARTHTAVVCGIHRGLVRGVMEALGEESTDIGLTPFVTPTRCLATLTATAPFEQRAHPPAAGEEPTGHRRGTDEEHQ